MNFKYLKLNCFVLLFLLFFGTVANSFAFAANETTPAEPTAHNTMQQMRERALKGDPRAQNYLGMIAFYGFGGTADYKKAMEWFSKAAEQGYPESMVQMGVLYENGLGVEADPLKAVEFYQKAADLNWPTAPFYLAQLYYRGIPKGKTAEDGFLMLQKSCSLGYRTACGMKLYYENRGEEALLDFQPACQKGDKIACVMIKEINEQITNQTAGLPIQNDLQNENNRTVIYLLMILAVLVCAAIALFLILRKSKEKV